MAEEAQKQLRAYVEYFRDLGVHDFYRTGEPGTVAWPEVEETRVEAPVVSAVAAPVVEKKVAAPVVVEELDRGADLPGKLVSFNDLAPLPEIRVAVAHRADALRAIQEDIGDCTRCPLAYAGRRKIVFADGDPAARLMFVGAAIH